MGGRKADQVLISVIMGVYNQWNQDDLYRAVLSVLEQTMENLEFIIWNDGSDERVTSYIKELEKLDDRIILAGRKENRGLAYSLNECIKLAKGKYIARMDADDTSLPKRFQYQYEFLEAHQEYSWCGCNAYLADENGIWGSRAMPEKPESKDYLKFSPYIHPTVMFRKEIFEACDGYNVSEETLRCEDYELFMRFFKRGYKGYNIQKRLFCYTENRGAFARRNFKARINEAKIRYKNFKELGLLPKGILYVLRPVIAGLVPAGILRKIKYIQCYKNVDKQKKVSANKELLVVEEMIPGRHSMT